MKYIKLFTDQEEIFNSLPDEEAGQLIKAVFAYMNNKEVELEGMLNAVFVPIRQGLDRSIEEYENIVVRNQENGKKGGRPSLEIKPNKPSGISGLAKKPKKSQDEEEDEEEKLAAVAEILSIKGKKAFMKNGSLYAHNKLVNNPVAYLEVLKKNEHPTTPQLTPAKQLSDQELGDFFKDKHIGETEGIPEDYVFEAMERKII